jgi:hypothetical protein
MPDDQQQDCRVNWADHEPLVAFYTARLDQTQRDAEGAAAETRPEWVAGDDGVFEGGLTDDRHRPAVAVGPYEHMADVVIDHIAGNDPKHVLMEVAAGRWIVDRYQAAVRDAQRLEATTDHLGPHEAAAIAYLQCIRAFAAAYHRHPGYLPLWTTPGRG